MQACMNIRLEEKDLVGTWRGPDSSEIHLEMNGSFSARYIPVKFGFIPSDTLNSDKFDGAGKWLLRKGETNWEVYLDFDHVTINKSGCAFPVLVAGENGLFDNKPPWYLFMWDDEEGGDRYKFKRR